MTILDTSSICGVLCIKSLHSGRHRGEVSVLSIVEGEASLVSEVFVIDGDERSRTFAVIGDFKFPHKGTFQCRESDHGEHAIVDVTVDVDVVGVDWIFFRKKCIVSLHKYALKSQIVGHGLSRAGGIDELLRDGRHGASFFVENNLARTRLEDACTVTVHEMIAVDEISADGVVRDLANPFAVDGDLRELDRPAVDDEAQAFLLERKRSHAEPIHIRLRKVDGMGDKTVERERSLARHFAHADESRLLHHSITSTKRDMVRIISYPSQ